MNNLNRGTVLIVDDTPGNLAVLSDMLFEAGYRVLVATDGKSALEQIGYLKPDIILLDVVMPGIDGFETCQQLKNDMATREIPIIFMTGLSELENLLRGFEEGAVDYIVKPIRPAEVIARIEAQFAQRKSQKRIEDTLNKVSFAALAFDRKNEITWLNSTAFSVLQDCVPDLTSIKIGDQLPIFLLKQITNQKGEINISGENDNEIRINDLYSGKIISCESIDEFLLLIQKQSDNWDLDTLKNNFGLTPREAEILMWIAKGKTNKEIGLILNSSPRTVNKHLEHVFEKLGVPTRSAAVAKVLNQK